MPISGRGWELHIVRREVQVKPGEPDRKRTVGTYQVFHNGVPQGAPDLSGEVAETKGPGKNRPAGNGRRIEQGTYALATQAGTRYVTWRYRESNDPDVTPKPGLELRNTGARSEILVHPGIGFLSSIGCINPCTSLPSQFEPIDYRNSRRRTIAIIEDLKAFAAANFPRTNGQPIPNATVVIDGEP